MFDKSVDAVKGLVAACKACNREGVKLRLLARSAGS
jgi:hypothetical protein